MIAAPRNPAEPGPGAKPATPRTVNRPHAPYVLVVEDEADLADMISYNLAREGYACEVASAGDAAIDMVRRRRPDLIVLDRMLPGISGDTVLSQLRHDVDTSDIPVILLTAKADESDELVGFALGADDYVTKPFSVKVLLARIASAIRRREVTEKESDSISEGPVRLDTGRHEVTVNGERVGLTATEFRILQALMKARARVLNRGQLIDTVFGTAVAVTDRTIDVHITALRKKLGAGAAWIQTVRGVGYTFRPPG